MAFVSRAERKLNTVDNKTVGPGAYISQSKYASNPSFAPFASTSERNLHKIVCNTSTPGIGSYSLTDIKVSNSQLDQWGLPKFSAPFASQADRFNYKKNSSPGPGAYSVPDKWRSTKKSRKSTACINWARIPSAPSIPGPSQIYGYEETTAGDLVQQKNPEPVHSGTVKDSVGPGHYQISTNHKPKGPSWSKAKIKREMRLPDTTGPEIGPGTYSENKISIAPMYKFTQNAIFISKPKKPQKELSQENIPGPGYYSLEKYNSFNKSKRLPRGLQNFGSNTIRFKKKSVEYDVGPGHYADFNLNKSCAESKAPFSSTNNRFKYPSSFTPGPGSYKDYNLTEDLNKKVWGRRGVFGSSEKRFVKKPEEETPGPGYYRSDKRKKIGSGSSLSKNPSSVFLSKSKRDLDIKKAQGPAPGSYEIGSKLGIPKPPAVSMHPVLSRVTRVESEPNLGFASRADRFNKSAKSTKTPGPGSYQWDLKSRPKDVILSKQDRFKPLNKSAIPGPGAYKEDTDEWNKRSYNILFSEMI
jgi:Sperm-tail PG-rich repeat